MGGAHGDEENLDPQLGMQLEYLPFNEGCGIFDAETVNTLGTSGEIMN